MEGILVSPGTATGAVPVAMDLITATDIYVQVMKVDLGGDGVSSPLVRGQLSATQSLPVVLASDQSPVVTTVSGVVVTTVSGTVPVSATGVVVSGTVGVSGTVVTSVSGTVVTTVSGTVPVSATGVVVSGTVGVSGTVVTSASGTTVVSVSGAVTVSATGLIVTPIQTSATQLRTIARVFATDGATPVDPGDSANSAIRVNIVAGAGGGTSMQDGAAFTTDFTSFTPIGGYMDDTLPGGITEGEGGTVRLTSARALHVHLRTSTGGDLGSAGQIRTEVINSVTITDGGGSITIDPVQLLATDATTAVNAGDSANSAMRVNVVAGAGGGTAGRDESVFVLATTNLTPVGGVYATVIDDVAAPTATSLGTLAAASLTQARALHVNLRTATGVEVGDAANSAIRVNIVAGGGSGGTSARDESDFVFASTLLTPIGGLYATTLDAVAAATATSQGKIAAPAITQYRGMHVSLRTASGAELGDPNSSNPQPVYTQIYDPNSPAAARVPSLGAWNALAVIPVDTAGELIGATNPLAVRAALFATDGSTRVNAGDSANSAMRVNIVAGAGGGTSARDESAFTFATTSLTPIGGVYATALDVVAAPTATSLSTVAAAALTETRALHVNLRGATGGLLDSGTAVVVAASGVVVTTVSGTVVTTVSGSVVTTVSGSVDTELPAAVALSDALANPTSPLVGAALLGWSTATNLWVRVPTTTNLGVLVNVATGTVVANATGSVAVRQTSATALLGAMSLMATSGTAAVNAGDATNNAVRVNVVTQAATLNVAASGTVVTSVSGSVSVAQTTATALNAAVQGTIAHDAADSGNPVKVGARARGTNIDLTATDDRVDLIADRAGRLLVVPHTLPGNLVNGKTSTVTSTSVTAVISAPTATDTKIFLTDLLVINGATGQATWVNILDGTTAKWTIYAAAAGGGARDTFVSPVPLSATTALQMQCETAGAEVRVSAAGFTGRMT